MTQKEKPSPSSTKTAKRQQQGVDSICSITPGPTLPFTNPSLRDDGATSSAPPPKASPLHVDSSSGSDDGSSSTIGSHADSFYASLVAAQQLRHQRTAALSTGAASSGTESGGLLSPSSSQPPRTLQDLLAWRQELLETRMKEHTERQQQYWQDSLSNSSNMNAGRLPPQRFSQTSLPLSLRQSSSQFSLSSLASLSGSASTPSSMVCEGDDGDSCSSVRHRVASPHSTKSSTDADEERHSAACVYAASAAPTCGKCRHCRTPFKTVSRSIPRHHVPSTDALASTMQRQPLPPSPGRTSSSPSSSSSSSSAPSSSMRRNTADRLHSTQSSTELRREMSSYVRLHDVEVNQSMTSRVAFLMLILVVVTLVFDSPSLPGGMWSPF